MPGDDQEKTEDASDKKREDMRQKGKVFRSTEATGTAVYLGVLLVLFFSASKMVTAMVGLNRKVFSIAGSFDLNIENAGILFKELSMDMGMIVFPVFLIGMLVAVGANVSQFGFLFTTEPFEFDPGKMNPITGFGRMFSMKTFFEFVKAIVKLGFVSYLTYSWMKNEIPTLLVLYDMTPMEIFNFMGRLLWKLSIPITILLVVVAVIDFIYQKFEYEKSIKMSKQEIKEESRQQDGDPKLKGKIKALQREMSMNRMMQAVPESTVVVTNPTHIAVALKYEHGQEGAPIVIAKGAGFVAQKIKELAGENNIPLVEDKPLARALFKTVEIGSEVPDTLYKAVAEVLAYIFKLKNRKLRTKKYGAS